MQVTLFEYDNTSESEEKGYFVSDIVDYRNNLLLF
jgi:hypothetical protein